MCYISHTNNDMEVTVKPSHLSAPRQLDDACFIPSACPITRYETTNPSRAHLLKLLAVWVVLMVVLYATYFGVSHA